MEVGAGQADVPEETIVKFQKLSPGTPRLAPSPRPSQERLSATAKGTDRAEDRRTGVRGNGRANKLERAETCRRQDLVTEVGTYRMQGGHRGGFQLALHGADICPRSC